MEVQLHLGYSISPRDNDRNAEHKQQVQFRLQITKANIKKQKASSKLSLINLQKSSQINCSSEKDNSVKIKQNNSNTNKHFANENQHIHSLEPKKYAKIIIQEITIYQSMVLFLLENICRSIYA